jgi:large subunit ribosomal protein L13
MKTIIPKEEDIERKWYHIDATDKTLGRLATKIATLLRGKHKSIFTPHLDVGDYVIVTNASRIYVTGKKMEDKKYYKYSGYPGGLRETNLKAMLEKHPERVIELAVKRMLPKNRLGRKIVKKLKVYAGDEHPHKAQQPEKIDL